MKPHAVSRQKPVPVLASKPRLGRSFPDIPTFNEAVIFAEVIGTTVSLKFWVCSAVTEGWAGERLGRAFCAITMGDRQVHPIKIGMISRTVTTCCKRLS